MQCILICMPRWDKISSQLTYWAKAIMSFTWVISFSFFLIVLAELETKGNVDFSAIILSRAELAMYLHVTPQGHLFIFGGRFSFDSPFCWRPLAQGGQISPLLSFHLNLFLISAIYLQQLLILIIREVIFFHWWFSQLLTRQQSHEVRSSVFSGFEAPVSGKSLLQYIR